METIHYFLKRFVEDMQKRPASGVDLEQHIAAYERKIREELMREAELVVLAERHRALAEEMKRTRTLLPMAGHSQGSSGCQLGA